MIIILAFCILEKKEESVMKNIVITDWLFNHLHEENQVIIDCRFDLSNPDAGVAAYNNAHLLGALHFDLEKDLSSEKQEHGGRHPLPKLEDFLEILENAGIDETTRVIAYDDGSYAMAARLWWLMKYVGHKEVYVLDGGFKEWVDKSYPITDKKHVNIKKTYNPSIQENLLVGISEVKEAIMDDEVQVVDARAPERFAGKVEPIDPIGGHIPSAQNFFFQRNLSNGKWKAVAQLNENFKDLSGKEVISYCGSGVTACVNVLAMDEAGITSKLYVGSWSDWCSYSDSPVEKD
jgi:thiosulfate/3-mercaptopyruvate sulfurtransferase